MAVEGLSTSVVAHGGPRVGVARRLLHVAERHAGVERCGDERVPEAMGTDPLADPSPARQALHRAVGGIAVHPPALLAQEDGAGAALADVEVERSGGRGARGMMACLPPLRMILSVR
jgi:hypothetical protein